MNTYAVTVTGRKFGKAATVLVTARNAKEAKRSGKGPAVDALTAAGGDRGELAVTTTVEKVA